MSQPRSGNPLTWLIDYVMDAPALPKRGERRVLIVSRFASPLGFLFHGIFAIIFWQIGVPPLAWFNLVSTAMWLTACIIYFRDDLITVKRLHWALIATAGFEIPLHGVLATVLLGANAGFYFYIITGMASISFFGFIPFWLRTALLIFLGACFVATAIYGHVVEPVYPINSNAELAFLLFNAAGAMMVLLMLLLMHERVTREAEDRLKEEHDRAEGLLLNILPKEIADRLKSTREVIADEFTDATILFADIVNFTSTSARMAPAEIVRRLNLVFSAFDEIAERHGVEKIKTIGDAYMVVAGLPRPRDDHAAVMVTMAREMLDAVEEINKSLDGDPIQIRIGLNSGPVVAGVIGRSKFAYDLWGDAVNVAARMEECSVPGEMRMTKATHDLVKDAFAFEDRGMVRIKGKGSMRAYALAMPSR